MFPNVAYDEVEERRYPRPDLTGIIRPFTMALASGTRLGRDVAIKVFIFNFFDELRRLGRH